ncbi:MAG TPA: metallophosphoesterase [Methanoregulaceae archaeon]|nr:metallophosphoesterase [Methanoregulaceae archaeon]
MLVGVMGDTHDHLPNIKRAVLEMNENSVDMILHTGDYIAPFVIPVLAGCESRVIGVFGNNDGDRELLTKKCAEYENLEIKGNFTELTLSGKRVALIHGHEKNILGDLIEGGLFDLVVHGHTHQKSISRKGRTLALNPGEICGYLTGRSSCALVDMRTLDTYSIEW